MIYRLFYQLARIYASISLHLFFDRIEVNGKDKIPKNVPLIFTPNHTNAFLDGVIALCLSGTVVSFLARADVFKVKILKPILKFCKIIPVYRLRDGTRNMSKNYETFSHVAMHLKRNRSILIFPEGNQKFTRHLRPLKKGLFRILNQTHKENCFPKVIPVGINYEHLTKSGFNLVVNFGESIDYRPPLSAGFLAEKMKLNDSITPLIQNIYNYDLQILSESEWLNNVAFNQERILNESEWLENTEFSDSFLNRVNEWRNLSFKRGLLPWYGKLNFLDILLFFPLMIMFLIMAPLKSLNKYISNRIGKHRAFKLSIVFALALVEVPIYLALLFFFFVRELAFIYSAILFACLLIYVLFKRTLEKYAFNFKRFRWKRNQPEEWKRSELLVSQIKYELSHDYKIPL